MPPKQKNVYRCSECGHEQAKWAGKCPACQEWNTLTESAPTSTVSSASVGVKSSASASLPSRPAMTLSQIRTKEFKHIPTGIGEFDRVLGGGIVPGGVMLLAGDPGCGKSTLLGSVANKMATPDRPTLYISGEESIEQIAMRHLRIGADSDNLLIGSEMDLSKVLGHIESIKPGLVIIDSIQSIASSELTGRVGDRSQVMEVSTILTRIAKELGISMILIGHVTKDGNIAGPKTIEHLVDVVLYFEGDKDSPLRILRGIKNRFGASDEVGCFEHTEDGIMEVPDPSGLLLGRRDEPAAGVAISITIEGRRPLPLEIQALVAPSAMPIPRRANSGIDNQRAVMVQAVTERHGGIRLADKDVYLATIGGVKTREPSVDLATVIALASAQLDIPTPINQVAIGEVTLSGEVRKVPGIGRRVAEAYRLGFTKAFIPEGSRAEAHKAVPQMTLIEVKTVQQAVAAVRAMA